MTKSNKFFLFILCASFLSALIAGGAVLYEKITSAKVSMQEKAIPSYHRTVHAVLLSMPVPGSISPRNRQLNAGLSKGKFLVASRKIRDPRFMETVILLVQHDSTGAVGLIVNRPTAVKLSEFFPEIKEQSGREHLTHVGGPVSMNQVSLLINSKEKIEGSDQIMDNVYISRSKTTLKRLIENAPKETRFKAYAGYAGWITGQLEHEVARGDWHIVQADAASVFDKSPSDVWPDLIGDIEVIHVKL